MELDVSRGRPCYLPATGRHAYFIGSCLILGPHAKQSWLSTSSPLTRFSDVTVLWPPSVLDQITVSGSTVTSVPTGSGVGIRAIGSPLFFSGVSGLFFSGVVALLAGVKRSSGFLPNRTVTMDFSVSTRTRIGDVTNAVAPGPAASTERQSQVSTSAQAPGAASSSARQIMADFIASPS